MTELPMGIRALATRGDAWARWVDEIPRLIAGLLDGWELRPDGVLTHGSSSIVQPVRTADDTPAVLKVSFPAAESEYAHVVLRRWNGDGSVRLLRADPRRRALLLERLHAETLASLPDVDACDVVASLYQRCM